MNKEEIKELLKHYGINQRELAKKLGVAPPTLSRLLKSPTTSTLQRISFVLGIDTLATGGGSVSLPIEDSPRIPENRAFVVCPKCGEKIPLDLYPASDSDNQ